MLRLSTTGAVLGIYESRTPEKHVARIPQSKSSNHRGKLNPPAGYPGQCKAVVQKERQDLLRGRKAAYFNCEAVSGDHNSRLVVDYRDIFVAVQLFWVPSTRAYHSERCAAACGSRHRSHVP